jgi:hypothetical protein
VDLMHVGKPAPRREVGQHQTQVVRTGRRIVVTLQRQVEAVERRRADPAVPVGEGDIDGDGTSLEGGAEGVQGGSLQEVGHVQVVVVELHRSGLARRLPLRPLRPGPARTGGSRAARWVAGGRARLS